MERWIVVEMMMLLLMAVVMMLMLDDVDQIDKLTTLSRQRTCRQLAVGCWLVVGGFLDE